MFGLREGIIDEIVKVISKYGEIDKAVVFGSRARGDYKKTSDIDLAIFSSNISSTKLNLLRDDIDTLDIIYKVDVVHFESLNKEGIIKNIENEGVIIYSR
jgi:uncharacterized protein